MPGGHLSFKPKRQGETCQVLFDFISSLAIGETISTQVVTCVLYSGSDTNPSAVISGLAAVQNVTQVTQLITAGVLGTIYELLCKITTSLGQTLEIAAYQAIYPDLV